MTAQILPSRLVKSVLHPAEKYSPGLDATSLNVSEWKAFEGD